MVIVALCERLGWDYHTYMAQPTWFVEGLLEKMRIDAQRVDKGKR